MAASVSPAIKRAKLAHHRHQHSNSAMNNHPLQKQQAQQQDDEHVRSNNISITDNNENPKKESELIPGLPDDLTKQCLSYLPPSLLFSVSHPWRRFLYSPSFPSPHFSIYSLLADNSPNPDSPCGQLSFYSYDPLTDKWDPLPPPPLSSPLILQHPSFISRLLPIQSLSSNPYLLLLSASNPSLKPALSCPLIFHPSPPRWRAGPSFPISPRRWCAGGSFNGSVFLFSGVGSLAYDPTLARSAFKWDPLNKTCHWRWDPLTPLKDGTFSREAVEAVASNGKLCMVNLRGRCPKEGAVYDVRMDRWEDMPTRLRTGWTGPAASDENGNIYVVNEVTGEIKVYQWRRDTWLTVVAGEERLKGATQMAARGGKVCIVTGGGEAIVVVDVVGRPGKKGMWIVEPPRGKKVVNVHVLPRMSRPESS